MTKIETDEFGLPPTTTLCIKNVINTYSCIVNAIVYGSRAKGNYTNSSDIDITLDAPEMSFPEYCQIATELDDLLLPYQIDLSLKHEIENPDLLDHIKRKGKILYSQHN